MIENGKNISTPQKTQVCIIGSGPAGITAAAELSNAGIDVIVLEGSRELDYATPNYYQQSWDDKVKLYNGLADGVFTENEPDFLIRPFNNYGGPWERERVYGGTSTHWGGQSRPLDSVVFEKRPGFPGWPITKADLDPYYADAVGFNHLYGDYGCDGLNFTAVFFAAEMQKQGIDARVPRIENFNPEMYQFMGKQWLNFATRTFENGTTISDSSARVIVNASVLNIVEQNGSVQYLNVASMNDDMSNPQKYTEFTVTADIYLLACGAVANARQLLLSGIGNNLVGRYFMCHPLSRGNIIQTTSTYMTPAEHNLMNGTDWTDPTGNGVNITGRFIADENIAKEHEIGRCWFWARNQYQSSQMFFEMTPNYDSFISLNDTTDPVFGQQQTHIHWELNDNDQKTYETNCNLFNQAISQHSGSISWPGWEEARSQWTVNGHHIGTTRMSASHRPDEGVVDQNLKIHGIDNMYVAGSSVFPSAGISNPTMTIIALSLRLAGKIHSEL